jgi:hypothetical protein
MRMEILSVLVLLLVAAGCSDSNNSATTSSGGNELTGDLIGKVTLYDYNGIVLANKSGALVQIEGTSYSAVTDSNGDWLIHNLPTRTYSLSISKDGYLPYHDYSYAFLGGGTTRYLFRYYYYRIFYEYAEVPLRQFPEFTIALDAILMPNIPHSDTSGLFYCHTSTNVPLGSLGVYIISGADSTLSADKPESYENGFYVQFGNYSRTDTSFNLASAIYSTSDGTSLVDGFSKGKTVYFRAFPGIGAEVYYDAIHNKGIPTGINYSGSNVLSGIMAY